jgi:hypothetical protein
VFRDDVGAIGARGKRWTAVAGGEAGKNGRAIPPTVAVGTEDETAQAHACEKRAQIGNAGRATMFPWGNAARQPGLPASGKRTRRECDAAGDRCGSGGVNRMRRWR